MTVTIRHGNLGSATTEIAGAVRLPSAAGESIQAPIWSLTEGGEKGATAMSGFALEDPSASAGLVGQKEVHFEDDACVDPTIFAGFFDQRGFSRAAALRTGAAREWDAQVTDCNVLLGDYAILAGSRPAETDIARIDWLLASGYLPIGDAGFIDRSSPVSMPKTDYTGRFPADVLAECSNASNKNYFVRWEQEAWFPDPASPWAPATPEVYTQGGASPAPSNLGDVNIPSHVVGSKWQVVVSWTAFGVILNKLDWQNSAHDPVAPWLDRTGTATPQIILGPQSELSGGTVTVNLGPCTFNYAPTGFLYAHAGAGGGPGGYDYGWLRSGVAYDSRCVWGMSVTLTPPGPGPCLGYHDTNWSGDTSGLAISNVLTDIDNVTTFGPQPADKLTRNPGRVYSGCWFDYSGGHVYVPNSMTLAAFRHRDVRASDMTCTTAAAATVLATAYLARCETEEDRITVNLTNVPAASVNLARPGQRIPVKLSHVPGYESGTYLAILQRTVAPVAYGSYNLALDLAEPKLTGYFPARTLAPAVWQNLGAVISPSPSDYTLSLPGQRVPPTFVADGDDTTVLFTLPTGYLAGSLLLWVDGQPIAQTAIAETDLDAGTLTLDFAPVGAAGAVPAQTLVASWQVA
jgi:hypothetical protein